MPGLLREGFNRAWRYQRVLWFIFFISFVLGHFGAGGITHKLEVTEHTLHAQRLIGLFDIGTFSALESNPEVNLFQVTGVSISSSLVFFAIVFFLTGGILEAYRSGRKLTTREFFEACGSYFWRLVRLFILMALVLAPALMLVSLVREKAISLMGNAAQEKMGFWLLVGGMAVIGLLLMCIRIWFHISLLGWLVFAAGLYICAKMPPARYGWTFLILELVVLWGFATRLWQRACEMIWYQRRFLGPLTAPAPV